VATVIGWPRLAEAIAVESGAGTGAAALQFGAKDIFGAAAEVLGVRHGDCIERRDHPYRKMRCRLWPTHRHIYTQINHPKPDRTIPDHTCDPSVGCDAFPVNWSIEHGAIDHGARREERILQQIAIMQLRPLSS
jgi:hypothetical protein